MAFTGGLGAAELLGLGASDAALAGFGAELGLVGAEAVPAAAAIDAGALAAGGLGLAGETGAFGAGTDAAALAAGGAGLAGEAGAFGAAAPVVGATGFEALPAVAPELGLPASTLPASAGISAVSATPEFPAISAATDPFAGWGATAAPSAAGGGLNPASTPWWTSTVNPADFAGGTSAIGDASSGFPSLAAQSAGVTPGDVVGGGLGGTSGAAPSSMTATPFAPTPSGGGAAAPAPTPTGVSPDALTSLTAGQTATAPPAAPAPSAPPAPAPGPPSSTGGGGFMDWIKANPVMAASLGIGGGMLAKNAISPPKLPNQDKLDAIAAQAQSMTAQNQALEARLLDPLATGNLPDAQQKQVDMALQDSITAIKSKFAGMGMSGSSVEQDEIANAKNKALALQGTLAEQMAQTGLSAGSQAASSLQIAGTIYEQIMQTQIQQDNALQQAIASFAGQAAMAGAISTAPRKVA